MHTVVARTAQEGEVCSRGNAEYFFPVLDS